jgi:adenosylcobinamide-GDP ribazoletransferase
MMRSQLELFFIAVGFFTRLPVPGWVAFEPQKLGHASRYLPLVGWLIGLLGVAVFWLSSLLLPPNLSIILSMVATLRATGAFHEDGWADCCDGLGGGWSREQVLAIMKDSRIGSYGTIGLVMMLLAKFHALDNLASYNPETLVLAMLVAHPLSRLAAVSLMAVLDYARTDTSAKSADAARRPSSVELGLATLGGILPLVMMEPMPALLCLGAACLVAGLAMRTFHLRLGGYTGDCLGATQQAAELAIYFGVQAAWSFT